MNYKSGMKRILKINGPNDFKKVLLRPHITQHSHQQSPDTASNEIYKLRTRLDDISAKLVELKTGGIN
ncbi:hypothetical protein J056_001308 [Wallemia ichthyophaga EXF-994]|uniref:Uncharacterized protein n=1 Tax=Wallemia ichthyophaga (strain EXF-994 / CBS 113033) TaxID=1299270 RepID=R9AD03_WALI9|nr:uncharacterized protein J056_001308 [Wallemia ichthyophaga EXF-994]EOR00079.1 hypothetical protein J056_001308 [Wallemia ichthyophaga EXF-994]